MPSTHIALDTEPPIASFLKSIRIGRGPVKRFVRPRDRGW